MENTKTSEQEMKEDRERKKEVISDLMKAFGIDEKIKNIKGFTIEVDADAPISISVKMMAGHDGMAHFIRTFNSKFTIEELVSGHGKPLSNKLEKCNEETHKQTQ